MPSRTKADPGQFFKTVASASTPEPLSASTLLVDSVEIIARKSRSTANTNPVWIGFSSSDGVPARSLAVGEAISLSSKEGKHINLAEIFIDAETDGDGVLVTYLIGGSVIGGASGGGSLASAIIASPTETIDFRSADTLNDAVAIKTSPGNLYAIHILNLHSATILAKFYDKVVVLPEAAIAQVIEFTVGQAGGGTVDIGYPGGVETFVNSGDESTSVEAGFLETLINASSNFTAARVDNVVTVTCVVAGAADAPSEGYVTNEITTLGVDEVVAVTIDPSTEEPKKVFAIGATPGQIVLRGADLPISFANGIALRVVTGAGDTDDTAPGTAPIIELEYK